MVSEADGIKGLRDKAIAHAESGDPPTIFKPIRKRGFHRALKRGDVWAVAVQRDKDFSKIMLGILSRHSLEIFSKPCPFTELLRDDQKSLAFVPIVRSP